MSTDLNNNLRSKTVWNTVKPALTTETCTIIMGAYRLEKDRCRANEGTVDVAPSGLLWSS